MTMKLDAKGLVAGMMVFEEKVDIAMRLYAETAAVKLEGEAKKKATWTDRSGDARRRIKGSVERRPTGYRIKVSHGVEYGIWLELANEKKYATIGPTIDLMSPEILRGARGLIDRIK